MNIVPFLLTNERSNSAIGTMASDLAPKKAADTLIGIGIIAVIPALFWTGAVWAASQVFGFEVTPAALGVLAVSIAAFLTIVCSAILAVN